MAREETTGDTWPANSCSAQWGRNRMRGKREGSRGAGASSRGRARQASKWMACIAAPHVRACHNIPPHVHLSLPMYIYPSTLSTLHMHSCPDCEAPNMSQFGANLSQFSSRCARWRHSVPLFALNILRLSVLRGLCIKCWTHPRVQMSNISVEGQRIQCKKGHGLPNRESLSSNWPSFNSSSPP